MLVSRPNAVITGAASGLGRSFATKLASRGARLILSDIDLEGLAETEREVGSRGGSSKSIRCDVSKPDEVKALSELANAELGAVDLLINNAGVAVGGEVGTIPLEDWQWIVGINLWGVVYGCHYFLPAMKARRSGHVLNVASIAAFAAAPEMAPYNVTKAGVVALSETLAGELSRSGVGVTVLCPYFFTTNIVKSSRSHTSRSTAPIETIMAKSKVQADDVASIAISACERNELYVFPHAESKVIAAMKRAVPETMLKRLAPWLAQRMQ